MRTEVRLSTHLPADDTSGHHSAIELAADFLDGQGVETTDCEYTIQPDAHDGLVTVDGVIHLAHTPLTREADARVDAALEALSDGAGPAHFHRLMLVHDHQPVGH